MSGGGHFFPAQVLAVMAGVLVCGAVVFWTTAGPNPALRQALGLSDALPVPLPRAPAIVISPHTVVFSPRVAVTACDSAVTVANRLDSPVDVRSAALSPSPFDLRLPAHGQGMIQLHRPGLYHYYDALTARPLRVVAGNDVITTPTDAFALRQGWIAVLCGLPRLQQHLGIPALQDLFAPKVLVAVAGSSVVVFNHDTDAHNFVIDPASPAGAAFVVSGTDAEPTSGWHRALVIQEPGLYHVYCTLHTRVVGVVDGWHIVVPRPTASGYRDQNPMEAWIVVLPAQTAT